MTHPNKIDDLPTPALLLDWPTAKRNIDRAATFVEGRSVRLRPHFKNHKCVPLAQAQLGARGCCGITAATVDEAVVLVVGDDLLLLRKL